MRKFEKISLEQFKKDNINGNLYSLYKLPERKTMGSAGYDFFFLEDCVVKKGEIVKVPTGIKVYMQSDEVLLLIIRSSLGFKYNLRLCNQVGVIDSDYYNNIDNEGHIFASLKNEGEKDLFFKKGDAFMQGIFIKYLTTEDEVTNVRKGGIGSTTKEAK